MTCIIGLQHEGKVYIGGDTQITFGWEAATSPSGKVWQHGDFIMGYTGNGCRDHDVIRYAFDIPADTTNAYDMRYMVRTFIPALRTLLKEHGASYTEDNKEVSGGALLIGVKGNLYHMSSNFSITTRADGYACLGSGDTYALGAMEALKGLPPMERIMKALEISAKFCIGVAAPFTVLEIG